MSRSENCAKPALDASHEVSCHSVLILVLWGGYCTHFIGKKIKTKRAQDYTTEPLFEHTERAFLHLAPVFKPVYLLPPLSCDSSFCLPGITGWSPSQTSRKKNSCDYKEKLLSKKASCWIISQGSYTINIVKTFPGDLGHGSMWGQFHARLEKVRRGEESTMGVSPDPDSMIMGPQCPVKLPRNHSFSLLVPWCSSLCSMNCSSFMSQIRFHIL